MQTPRETSTTMPVVLSGSSPRTRAGRMSIIERTMQFSLPVGDGACILFKRFHSPQEHLRTLSANLEELGLLQATIGPSDERHLQDVLKRVNNNIIAMSSKFERDPPKLWIPMSFGAIFPSVYGGLDYLHQKASSHQDRMSPPGATLFDATDMMPWDDACNRRATAYASFKRIFPVINEHIHSFIRDARPVEVSVGDRINRMCITEIDVIAAARPKLGIALLNCLFEAMALSCIDRGQNPGFASRYVPRMGSSTGPRPVFDEPSRTIALRSSMGSSDTIAGHACFLFIVLTQLNEDEYTRYCTRIGLPSILNTPGRRAVFDRATISDFSVSHQLVFRPVDRMLDPHALVGGDPPVVVVPVAVTRPIPCPPFTPPAAPPRQFEYHRRTYTTPVLSPGERMSPAPPAVQRTRPSATKKTSKYWAMVAQRRYDELMDIALDSDRGSSSSSPVKSPSSISYTWTGPAVHARTRDIPLPIPRSDVPSHAPAAQDGAAHPTRIHGGNGVFTLHVGGKTLSIIPDHEERDTPGDASDECDTDSDSDTERPSAQ